MSLVEMPGAQLPAVGAVLELTVGEVAAGGCCAARQEPGGPVIFVRHALPGERVRVRVTQATSRLARADAIEIRQASPDRVAPPCPHARPGGCGGCDWQHASLPAQRSLKAEVIRQQMRRIAGLDCAVTVESLEGDDDTGGNTGNVGDGDGAAGDGGAAGDDRAAGDGSAAGGGSAADGGSAAGLGWRTRVRFAVRHDGRTGLRKHRSHDIIDVGACPIAHPLVTETAVTRRRWPGAKSVEVLVAVASGERAVVVTGPPARWNSGARPAAQAIGADTVLAAGTTGRLVSLRGRGYLTEGAAGRSWRVSAGTFWQVHPAAADALAAAVLGMLAPLPGDRALDLYCGAGLFAGVLADAVGPDGGVVGVEENAAAVRDARHNLRATPWAQVHRGDVAAVLAQGGLSGASLAVLDPPRTGLPRAVIDLLRGVPGAGTDAGGTGAAGAGAASTDGDRTAGGLRRIAYVSCDPATLARDLVAFRAAGWRLAELRAFDAFPMTHHVECLAALVPDVGNPDAAAPVAGAPAAPAAETEKAG